MPAQPAKFFWFLPTNGDSRSIVGASHESTHHTVPANYRAPSRRYLAEVARAADRLGADRRRTAGRNRASHEEVANLIYEYHSLGFDEFILSGYPHLEEAYWFAEGVLPLLRQKGVA